MILKYNNAASYALAVALLSDRMADRPALTASWPRDERPLSRAERVQFQTDLKLLGFDPGVADGVLGRNSRAALRHYQKARGLLADGFPHRRAAGEDWKRRAPAFHAAIATLQTRAPAILRTRSNRRPSPTATKAQPRKS